MTVEMGVEAAIFDDESLALEYVVKTLINNKINTCEVVKVVSVNSDKNEVAVIPVVKNVDAKGDAIEESTVYGIKYFRWQYGKNSIIAEPVEGDIGLMVVSKRDISKIDAGIVDSRRRFNLADGIYIGGICGFNQAPTQYIKFDDNGIEIKSDKEIKVNAQTITATSTTATLTTTGDTTISGGNVTITGSNVAISGSAVSLGGGGGEKAIALDGDKVYSGTTEIGIIKATSQNVKAS